MPFAHHGDFTGLLAAVRNGDPEAKEQLVALVYQDLRRLARHHMSRERADHTLQPTALVNEVYMDLFGEEIIEYQNRSHFFIVASQQMRRILIDRARAHNAARRSGGFIKVPLDAAADVPQEIDLDLVALDDALTELESFDPEVSKVVELRFFGGLTVQEVATFLDISIAKVKRDWEYAKVWLYNRLSVSSKD